MLQLNKYEIVPILLAFVGIGSVTVILSLIFYSILLPAKQFQVRKRMLLSRRLSMTAVNTLNIRQIVAHPTAT